VVAAQPVPLVVLARLNPQRALAALAISVALVGSGILALSPVTSAPQLPSVGQPVSVVVPHRALAATSTAGSVMGAATVVTPVAPAPTVPPRVEAPALQAALDPLVQVAPPGALGVSVSAEDGTPVYAHNAHLPLVPASTEKSVVAAAALRLLGPDHRYRTEVRAGAAPGPDGVVHGPLVLVGGGDPALGTPDLARVAPTRPRTHLEVLADQVVASGVRHVTGGLVGDASVWAHEPMAPGWVPGHVGNGHAALVSGLTVDAGRHVPRPGDPHGARPSADPALLAAESFRDLLAARGVVVDGPVQSSTVPIEANPVVAAVESTTVRSLVSHMVQTSDNHMADAIFRSLGAEIGDPTWTGAAEATRRALDGLALRWDGVSLVDGSGLSRSNRVTPDLLTDLAAAMSATELRPAWEDAQAVTGRRGTLRGRMLGTPAEGRVLAKTGTLSDVRALSGTVVGSHGGRYHFAVIGNDLPGGSVGAVRELQDQVAVALVQELDRQNPSSL
jgi:serine-type D-Ala-D-Ala carboxypeptidase/endopeptidase (penicillin-binding protein 4)